MNKAIRAAQFNSFDALKGLQEALRAKEEIFTRTEKSELDEDAESELSSTLLSLMRGTPVDVTFFLGGHYIGIIGAVTDVIPSLRLLIVDDQKISFDSIRKVTVL